MSRPLYFFILIRTIHVQQITHLLDQNLIITIGLVSYLHWTLSCLFVFFLTNKRFRCTSWTIFRTVRPPNLLFDRFLVWSFYFSSFYKLGNLLSLNFAERQFLTVFGVSVGVTHIVTFWTFGITGASLAPTEIDYTFVTIYHFITTTYNFNVPDRARGAH